MTDVEAVLRDRLHAQLDGLEPSTLTAREALRSGRRARRRRTAVVSVAAALAVAAAGTTAAAIVNRGPTHQSSVVAAGDLARRTVTYAEQFRDGDFAGIRRDMTPDVRAELSEAQLRSVWRDALANLGPLVRITPAVKDSDASGTYLSPLHFRSGDANLRVTYDADGHIIGLTLLSADVQQLGSVPPELADTSRAVVDALVHARYDEVRSRFDNTMARLLTVGQVRDAWQAAVHEHGGFVSRGGLTATKVRASTVVDVFCTMTRGELRVRISYDDAGLISGLFLQTT